MFLEALIFFFQLFRSYYRLCALHSARSIFRDANVIFFSLMASYNFFFFFLYFCRRRKLHLNPHAYLFNNLQRRVKEIIKIKTQNIGRKIVKKKQQQKALVTRPRVEAYFRWLISVWQNVLDRLGDTECSDGFYYFRAIKECYIII